MRHASFKVILLRNMFRMGVSSVARSMFPRVMPSNMAINISQNLHSLFLWHFRWGSIKERKKVCLWVFRVSFMTEIEISCYFIKIINKPKRFYKPKVHFLLKIQYICKPFWCFYIWFFQLYFMPETQKWQYLQCYMCYHFHFFCVQRGLTLP